MDKGDPPLVVPTARPYLSRRKRWRLRTARTAQTVVRSPKAVAVIGALGSIVLAWVIVTAAT
jgi:hypothetical protein